MLGLVLKDLKSGDAQPGLFAVLLVANILPQHSLHYLYKMNNKN